MHLSLLSEPAFLEGPVAHEDAARPSARAHREGLIRGVLFLTAIALPLTLAIATGHAGPQNPSAGYAQSFGADR